MSPQQISVLEEELRYLRFLVWKLSVRDLAQQHHKYNRWLTRSYVSTREKDWGTDDSASAVPASGTV